MDAARNQERATRRCYNRRMTSKLPKLRGKSPMPTSTITSKGQTTVPKEVRDVLDIGPGDRITWEVNGRRVSVTTERPALYELQGFIKHGPDALTAVAKARKTRGRV